MGSLPAVSTSAIRMGEAVSETISHDSPTSCIHDPRLDATVAIQSARKTGTQSRQCGHSFFLRLSNPGVTMTRSSRLHSGIRANALHLRQTTVLKNVIPSVLCLHR